MTKSKELKDKLEYSAKNGWTIANDKSTEINNFSKGYINFLSVCKTERQTVNFCEQLFTEKGFTKDTSTNFFITHKEKNIAIVKLNKEQDITKGAKIVVAHVDCPRLDLKPNPQYEDSDLAYLKTHYYGGIKKYQWVARALAIHGVIFTKDGERIDISIGEDDSDPVLYIPDLLPHLAGKAQGDKKIKDAIKGEQLNVLIGNKPLIFDDNKDDAKSEVKLNILKLLNEKYGIAEEDFITAELEIVPAGKARELGLDRSMVGAYGQDDRVCSYAAMQAILDADTSDKPMIVWLVDKEEIGSDGNTGAKSAFIKQIIKQCIINQGQEPTSLLIDDCLFNSIAVSADVTGAFDPEWKEVYEARNSAKLGFGVCMEKYGGSRGKAGSSDANAEYIAHLRRIFNNNEVIWQPGTLGKVDEGGGGTVAKFLASYGMEIVDLGTPVLAMHSPMECCSKLDIYMTYLSYKVFLEKA